MEENRNFRKNFEPRKNNKIPGNKVPNNKIAEYRTFGSDSYTAPFPYKTKLCVKKYLKNCFMGKDCTYLHIDDDINDIKEKFEQIKSNIDNYSKKFLSKKIKIEIDDANNNSPDFQLQTYAEKFNKNKQEIEGDNFNSFNSFNNFDKSQKINTSESPQDLQDEEVYNGLCYDTNNLAMGCNIYSNLVGNYVSKKNFVIVSIMGDILNNLDKITNNAILLKSMLSSFPIFKKLYYNYNTGEHISFAASNPFYKIQKNDSIETKEEKIKIISLDKLNYTNMVIAHQVSVITKIYQYCGNKDINIFTPLINSISKDFIVDLYLSFYYSRYREPVTDEMCEMLLKTQENKQNFDAHSQQENIEQQNIEQQKVKQEIIEQQNIQQENIEQENFDAHSKQQNIGQQNIKQENIETEDMDISYENANQIENTNLSFSDEVKQFLRYFQK